jgi:cytochrome c551/c552
MDKGVLRFDAVGQSGCRSGNFSAERWNYKRTPSYGSPHFKLDGSKGQEAMVPSSAYLSRDEKTVFVAIPDMKPVMQMRVGWTLAMKGGARFDQNTYFTPYELSRFDPSAEGFETLTVDLSPRSAGTVATTPVTIEEGKRVAELMGCVACHSTDGSILGKVGPTWKGLFGSEVAFADGSKMRADEDYFRESIREPAAKVVRGFDKSDTSMPSYEGLLSDPKSRR